MTNVAKKQASAFQIRATSFGLQHWIRSTLEYKIQSPLHVKISCDHSPLATVCPDIWEPNEVRFTPRFESQLRILASIHESAVDEPSTRPLYFQRRPRIVIILGGGVQSSLHVGTPFDHSSAPTLFPVIEKYARWGPTQNFVNYRIFANKRRGFYLFNFRLRGLLLERGVDSRCINLIQILESESAQCGSVRCRTCGNCRNFFDHFECPQFSSRLYNTKPVFAFFLKKTWLTRSTSPNLFLESYVELLKAIEHSQQYSY